MNFILIATIILLFLVIVLLLIRLHSCEPVGTIISDQDNSLYIQMDSQDDYEKLKHQRIVSFRVRSRR